MCIWRFIFLLQMVRSSIFVAKLPIIGCLLYFYVSLLQVANCIYIVQARQN